MSQLVASAQQIRAARALLGWSQDHLAAKFNMSIASVAILEARDEAVSASDAAAQRARAALTAAGIEFTHDEGGWIGVRFRATALDSAAERIDDLEATAAGMDLSGPPSPRRAMNTMKRAVASNDAANLREKLKRKKREELPG